MRRYLIHIVLLLWLFSSCSGPLSLQDRTYLRQSAQRYIPYQISELDASTGRLLVVIPDNPDTSTLHSSLLNEFHRHHYQILKIYKPGKDIYQKRALDSREDRIADILSLMYSVDSLWSEELILSGIGEGAYLLPELAKSLNPAKLIYINAGVQSPLAEIEFMAKADSLDIKEKKFLDQMALTQTELLQRIDNIKDNPFGGDQLAYASNRNWLSYYNKPLLNQLVFHQPPALWINLEAYALISSEGIALTQMMLSRNPGIQYLLITHGQEKERLFNQELKKLMNWR